MTKRPCVRFLTLLGLLEAAPLAACAQAQPATPARAAGAPTAGETAFFPGAEHDPAIPTPESLLGFPVGERAATHAEIERAFKAWAEASDRATLFEYARSHEGRALYYLVIASPENSQRLEAIKADLAKLADPRTVSAGEGDRLARSLPAVAWLAYCIHGDETSGSDAALAVAHHLIASNDEETRRMLQELVIVIDPLMNPDGRDRFLKQVREHRSNTPQVDDQALLHEGYWPWGRTNHYLFDLNRDWIIAAHPETRGRMRAVNEWRPLLFVDSHEMGAQDTFLFSPSREPVNPNLPPKRREWWNVFAKDQAAAFDRYGWRYYTGEWNEEWYPGYSSSWAGFKGAVGILYEQAAIADQAVRRPEGTLMTYRESVHHQLESTMANLRTLLEHHETMMREFAAERRAAVAADAPRAGRTFAVTPTANATRMREFIEFLSLQGIEAHRATRAFRAGGVDRLGREVSDREFPAGTILISNRQPEAALVSAALEFDPRMTPEFLEKERREILREGESLLYDVTAWNATMLRDLEAFALEAPLPDGAERIDASPAATSGLDRPNAQVAFVIDGADDASVAAAGRLMEREAQVRVSDRAFTFGGASFARGSLVIARADNQEFSGGWAALGAVVDEVAREVGVAARGVDTGYGVGDDVPDLGGEHFILLARPRIALLSRGRVDPYSFGSAWFTLDKRLGVRVSEVSEERLSDLDLRRYNVLIVPSMGGGAPDAEALSRVRDWVKAGGTLIAIGRSAAALAKEDAGFTSARTLPDVLDRLDEFEQAVLREWAGRTAQVETDRVWRRTVGAQERYPWGDVADRASTEELKRRDAWQRMFMPQGAIVAGRVDDRSWLTAGLGMETAILVAGSAPIMAGEGVAAPVRLGVFNRADAPEAMVTRPEAGEGPPKRERLGWAAPPGGHELLLRMSGLLWPEAAVRIANSAYVTRESLGDGQVILFAGDPVFRAATMGTGRIFANAVILGPGMGARQPIIP